jgi:hypothetical protein
VAVTVDTRVSGPDGYVGGWLTATAGDLVVGTPVAVNKEVESYDVTLTHLDRAGATPVFFQTKLAQRDGTYQITWDGPDPGGTVTLRVPKGHYTVLSAVDTLEGAGVPAEPGGKPEPPPSNATLLGQPDLDVDQPRTVTLDARLGQPLWVTVPQPSAQQVYAEVAAGIGTGGIAVLGDSFATLYSARIGPDQHDDRFHSVVAGQWARANPDGSTDDSPYLYVLFFPVRGQMVTGYQRSVTNRELAGSAPTSRSLSPTRSAKNASAPAWSTSTAATSAPGCASTCRLPAPSTTTPTRASSNRRATSGNGPGTTCWPTARQRPTPPTAPVAPTTSGGTVASS